MDGSDRGKESALRWNEEPPTTGTAPRRSQDLPTEEMRQMALAAAELRRRTQPRPASRPRPITTGQVPVARTRATPAAPSDTTQQPVARPAAPGPQAPERRRLRAAPPVRDTADEIAAPATRQLPAVPVDRVAAPPAPPATATPPRTKPLPLVQPSASDTASAPAIRHASKPVPRLAPPPPPPVADDLLPTRPRRRPVRGLIASLFVAGLLGVTGLPSIASEADDAPPVAGVHVGDDLQQFQVGSGVTGSGTTTDLMAGEMPVSAPTWVVPVHGDLRDGFGPRLAQPVPGVSLFHRGQDIGGGCGAAIHAASAGVVETATYWGTYGNWVLIDHGNGVETGYAHQERYIVHVGQHVAAGQVIGYEGRTGAATGCHLHLEVHLNGVAVNPIPFFIAKGVPLGG